MIVDAKSAKRPGSEAHRVYREPPAFAHIKETGGLQSLEKRVLYFIVSVRIQGVL